MSNSTNFVYKAGHNILELYSVLAQFWFAISKTKLNIYYDKLGIQVALKSGNIKKNMKLGLEQCTVSLPEIKFC